MARNKEITVILLDVGPDMESALQYASRALTTFIAEKMLHRKHDEVAVVFFGSEGTNNRLDDEAVSGGEYSEYANISTELEMRRPDIGHLSAVASIVAGRPGTLSDFFSGVMVALDVFHQTVTVRLELSKAHKRIILVSNFRAAFKDDGGMLEAGVAARMNEQDILLEVLQLDQAPAHAVGATDDDRANTVALLDKVCAAVPSIRRRVEFGVDLIPCLKGKGTNMRIAPSHCYRKGDFQISPSCSVAFKVSKKVAAEKVPSMQQYSHISQAEDAEHGVSRLTEYKLKSDPDKEVTPDERSPAYMYGRDFVPMEPAVEGAMAYPPVGSPQGIQLLGFQPSVDMPRSFFMKDVWLLAPDKDVERSKAAFSAVVRAMARKQQLAVVRWQVGRNISVCVCSPLLGGGAVPDCMLMNTLPMADDVRQFSFPSFDVKQRPQGAPSAQQLTAARSLVQSYDLTASGTELLQPERLPNPVLYRFMEAVTRRALDPLAALPTSDPLAERLLELPLAALPAAALQLEALPDIFTLTRREATGTVAMDIAPLPQLEAAPSQAPAVESSVDAVGSADPVADFRSLVTAGHVEGAIAGMQAIIGDLVSASINERGYVKPMDALRALRDDAVNCCRAESFNAFLAELAAKFEFDKFKSAFWLRVVSEGISLVSEEEAGQGASKQEAIAFLQKHCGRVKVEEALPAGGAIPAEEDELDDME